MNDFHKTRMGHRFFESTMPAIADALTKLANPPVTVVETSEGKPIYNAELTELVAAARDITCSRDEQGNFDAPGQRLLDALVPFDDIEV